MDETKLGEVVSSKARLIIADLVSRRPRTLRELSQVTGISVQGVLKHLAKLEGLGLVEERRIAGGSVARKVYSSKGYHIGDFSDGGLMVVKTKPREWNAEAVTGPPLRTLQALSEDTLVQRLRIREEARRLGRMIDELFGTEERLNGAIESIKLTDEERLVVRAYFGEETPEEAVEVLTKNFGIADARRTIERGLRKVRKDVKE